MASRRNRSVSINFNGHRTPQEEQKMKKSIGELEDIYSMLKYEWPNVIQENANPLEMAIALLDDTSVGLAYKYPEFQHIGKETQVALRNVVTEYHEVFNNSIGSYHLLLSLLEASQSDTEEIRQMLEESTKDIERTSEEMTDLSNSSARCTEVIEILDAMEELTLIPERTEKFIADKKIHEVYNIIYKGYKLVEQYNLRSFSAMATTLSYLEMQSNNLFNMIISELQSDLFLKNPTVLAEEASGKYFTASVLSKFASPQLSSLRTLLTELKNLEQFIYNSANLDIAEVANCLNEPVDTFIEEILPKLHQQFLNEDQNIDYSILLYQATNSYKYIYMLLSTAAKLKRLPQALEILLNSNQQEFQELLKAATEETKIRNMPLMSRLTKLKGLQGAHDGDIVDGHALNDSVVVILLDLFGEVFMKTLVIMQKHKVVSAAVELLKVGDTLNYSYNVTDIWNVLTKELRSFISTYTYHQPLFDNNQTGTKPENFKGKTFDELFRKGETFKFENMNWVESTRLNELMKTVLRDMFPGLSLSSNQLADSINKESKGLTELQSLYIQQEAYRRTEQVLVPKNILNMRIILDFFLLFADASQKLLSESKNEVDVKNKKKPFLNFFVSYMEADFLPKLKQRLNMAFGEVFSGALPGLSSINGDASIKSSIRNFSTDIYPFEQMESNHAPIKYSSSPQMSKVVYCNAFNFKNLFTKACFALNTTSSYRQGYCDVCLELLDKFCTVYVDFYKSLFMPIDSNSQFELSDSETRSSLQLSIWMRVPALTEISHFILEGDVDANEIESLIDKEVEMMLYGNKGGDSESFEINDDDFLDSDRVTQLCYLVSTMEWVLGWLTPMRKDYVPDNEENSVSDAEKVKFKWSFLENGLTRHDTQDRVCLTLGSKELSRFENVLEQLSAIRVKSLVALRYDIRCKALYYLRFSFGSNDWVLPSEPGDSDQIISSFNREAFALENQYSSLLDEKRKNKMFLGVTKFINKLLVQGSFLISKINQNGFKKILLNIFTLQQMMRHLSTNPETVDFTLISEYFGLLSKPEYYLLDHIKKTRQYFSEEEYKNLARLIYSEKLAHGGGSSFNKTKYNELMKKISTIYTS